jgi:hypothetical protein
VEISGMRHDLARYDSQKQYLDRAAPAAPHPFQSGLIEVMMRWMEALLS